jgi:hypothetical protein
MRWWVVLAAVVLALAPIGGGRAQAQSDEPEFQNDVMIQLGDYDSFKVPGRQGAESCAEACRRDPRCKAWTYIRPVEQCRLKHAVGVAVANKCCVSGIKDRKAAGGSRQDFCADYASQAVSANDANLQQDCRLTGTRWTSDYRTHFSWCLRVNKAEAQQETELRGAEVVRCQRRADRSSTSLCDHYAQMTMIMINAQNRGQCDFNPANNRWKADRNFHLRACKAAPNRVPGAEFEIRQRQLSTCFERAGKEEEACVAFADDAVAHYDKAVEAQCEFAESRKWNSSKARHYVWCLEASQKEREELSFERDDEIAGCRRQAVLRKSCGVYAENAIEQAALNENERCGLKGEAWSKYKDDHISYCMQEGDRAARRRADERQSELETCIAENNAQNEECQRYADRAVKLARVNEDKNCGNRDRRLWSTSSREHYDFCMRAKPGIRQETQQARRKAIQSCSLFRGFRLEIQF